MTKEKLDKIAKRYAQDELKDNHGQVEDIVAAAFLNGIDYAEHHPNWISVEDELPPYGQQVLAYSEHATDYGIWWSERHGEGGDFLNLDSNGFSTLRYDDNEPIQVTHWMPLHEPPKKGGEE